MIALLPYRHTWISQGMNGSYSHRGTKAIDFGSLAQYKDYDLYAPFDGTVVWADSISKGGAIALQSDFPVEYADGTVDYMTVITGHDNNRPVAGKKFKQGELYSHMGTAGNVAKHSHIEVQKGKFVKPISYLPQEYGKVYKFENTIEPYKALFITDNTVIRSVAEGSVAEYPWKKEGENLSLIKIKKEEGYEYKWSVDGNKYGDQYDITTYKGFTDDELAKDGWELVLKVNGSLFYTYENKHYACGLEKSRGVNNQELEMSAVTDYNACMAIAGVGEDLYFGSQGWIIGNVLNKAYCAITGLGLLLSGSKRNDLHKGFEAQWNQISGRTVIGEDEKGNFLSYSFAGETGKSGMTCSQLQDECLRLGFVNAICLDGGGSVFRQYRNSQDQLVYDITTSRKVKNALLLYRRKKEAAPQIDWEKKYNELVVSYHELEDTVSDLKDRIESVNNEKLELEALVAKQENVLNKAQNKLTRLKEILNEDS